jgi:FkbM family methyltransferase
VFKQVSGRARVASSIDALHMTVADNFARFVCNFAAQPRLTPVSVAVRGLIHPILLRPATSDYSTFDQIFVQQEYAPLVDLVKDPQLIVDCGANVGYTSAYFLSKFPRASVFALEPDPDNVEICRRNLAPYGERARVLAKAVWSYPTRLTLLHFGHLGDNGENGVQVFDASEPKSQDGRVDFPEHVHRGPNPPIPSGEVEAMDLPSILELCGGGPIDLLKMDIEKSEMVIFGHAPLPWLSCVKNIVIELHNPEAHKRFFRALQPCKYKQMISGELTICYSITLQAPSTPPADNRF